MKLNLVKTCDACPEQYDVFDENGDYVAYMRLRWGYFSASMDNGHGAVMGKEVYSFDIGDGISGQFKDDKQRQKHLKKAKKAIKRELKLRRKEQENVQDTY